MQAIPDDDVQDAELVNHMQCLAATAALKIMLKFGISVCHEYDS